MSRPKTLSVTSAGSVVSVGSVVPAFSAFLMAVLGFLCGLEMAANAQTERFEEKQTVVLVEVPVQVLRDGNPVRGLTRDDFEIRSGGQLQEIIDFESIDLETPETPDAPSPRLAARRQFLFLFDLTFSDPGSIGRAKDAARSLAGSGLHPSDLVAVASYRASRGAEVILGFTTDREQLALALDSLSPSQPHPGSRDPLGLVLFDPMEAGSPLTGAVSRSNQKEERRAEQDQIARDLMTLQSRQVRDQRQAEILSLTSSLEELAKLLADLPGRKQVVLLSEGFDGSMLSGTQDFARIQEMAADSASGQFFRVDSEERFGSGSVQTALNRALDEFRRADCAIQAVDIAGINSSMNVRPQVGGEDGLFMMAEDTGGEFYRNYNDLAGAVDDLMERTSVTYLLAIQPPDLKTDGRYHALKVRLRDAPKGTRLTHRPGFYAPRPFRELNAEERRVNTAGLIMGGSQGGRLSTSLLVAPFPGSSSAYVPVILEMDGSDLLADANRGVDAGNLPLEIYGYAIDAKGSVENFFAQAMSLDLAQVGDVMRRTGVKFWAGFELPPADYVIRVLVRNRSTGSSSLRIVPSRVPEQTAGQPYLLPPLIREAPEEWIRTQETGGQPDVPFPFRLNGKPFVPAARPVLKRDQLTAVSLVASALGDSESYSDTAARAELVGANGQTEAMPSITLMTRETPGDSGLSHLTAELAVGQVSPGDYELVVTLTSPSKGILVSRIPVVVEG